jgi:hypothetical protein
MAEEKTETRGYLGGRLVVYDEPVRDEDFDEEPVRDEDFDEDFDEEFDEDPAEDKKNETNPEDIKKFLKSKLPSEDEIAVLNRTKPFGRVDTLQIFQLIFDFLPFSTLVKFGTCSKWCWYLVLRMAIYCDDLRDSLYYLNFLNENSIQTNRLIKLVGTYGLTPMCRELLTQDEEFSRLLSVYGDTYRYPETINKFRKDLLANTISDAHSILSHALLSHYPITEEFLKVVTTLIVKEGQEVIRKGTEIYVDSRLLPIIVNYYTLKGIRHRFDRLKYCLKLQLGEHYQSVIDRRMMLAPGSISIKDIIGALCDDNLSDEMMNWILAVSGCRRPESYDRLFSSGMIQSYKRVFDYLMTDLLENGHHDYFIDCLKKSTLQR